MIRASSQATAPSPTPVPSGNRLLALTSWPSFHPWSTVAALRQYVFNEKSNGASVWVRRVGRRVVILEQEFFAWVELQSTMSRGAK